MRNTLSAVIALLFACAGTARAANVEFRILERRGQTSWIFTSPSTPTNDNILNLAVQARVVGGSTGEALGNFGINMIMPGESESAGTLSKARISIAGTGAYDTSASRYNDSSTVGVGGLAATYAYLAGIGADFNGLINASGGTWTQTPDQDIGKITGSPTGGSLLTTFGAAGRTDGLGNFVPDSWVSGTMAPLDQSLADLYLGANGNWCDVYHFNYTITSTTPRSLSFTLSGAFAQTFSGLQLANSVWGPASPADATVSVANLSLVVIPAPSLIGTTIPIALLTLGTRRRR